MAERPLLVFDVNETLLDLEALRPLFARVFDDAGALRAWFAELVLYSEALTLAGAYAPFGEIGGAVLKMLARIRSVDVRDADLEELKHRVASLPPHADARPGLERLRDAGFRLFTLTNNPAATAAAQLEGAGLAGLFERQFSVDAEVRRFKPAPETYAAVAAALEAPASAFWLVACHTWDTLGARAAGWSSALLLRPGNAPLDVGPQPDLIADDLEALAERLVKKFEGDAAPRRGPF